MCLVAGDLVRGQGDHLNLGVSILVARSDWTRLSSAKQRAHGDVWAQSLRDGRMPVNGSELTIENEDIDEGLKGFNDLLLVVE